MIRHIRHSNIDLVKWNACVETSANTLIYAQSWYLDLVSPGWDALVEDDFKRVMPLTGKTRFGIHYLAQPFFCQQLGLFSPDLITPSKFNEFISAVPPKFIWVDINCNNYNVFLSDESPANISCSSRLTYELPLHKSYEEIQRNFSRDHNRNLRSARKHSLQLRETKPEQVIELYLSSIARKTPEIKKGDYRRLNDLMTKALGMKKAICWGVFDQSEHLIASAFFLNDKHRIIFLFGAASSAGRKSGAMRFLFDELIQQFAGTPSLLDFEGSAIPSVARFYQGFGAKKNFFTHIHYARHSVYEWMNTAREIKNELQYLLRTKRKFSAAATS